MVNSYQSNIYFEDLISSQRLLMLCDERARVVIITDDRIAPIYGVSLCAHFQSHQIVVHTIIVPQGECSKSREMKAVIEDQLIALGCGRDTLLIALGGGVITDLVGFVAATYCRGIPVIYIPTSLLGMVDAAIGGKTGINVPPGKNNVGTFTQPTAIFVDVNCLMTLPEVEYVGAFSEIIKHALIADVEYFALIESQFNAIDEKNLVTVLKIIQRSCTIKTSIVSQDETENGLREILNFGHTIAHAIEIASDYRIAHGQAVMLGIFAESFLSNQLGFLSNQDFMRIQLLVQHFYDQLPPCALPEKKTLLTALSFDKKIRNQLLRFVLLEKIGTVVKKHSCYAHTVNLSWVEKSIDYITNL